MRQWCWCSPTQHTTSEMYFPIIITNALCGHGQKLGLDRKTAHMSRIANRHPMVHWESQTVLIWMVCDCTTSLSIPSHFTMERNRRTGTLPKCPICYTVYPVHPIPTSPWDRMDELGSYQSVPSATPCFHCPSHPIPSHCTIKWTDLNSSHS